MLNYFKRYNFKPILSCGHRRPNIKYDITATFKEKVGSLFPSFVVINSGPYNKQDNELV